MASGHPNSTWNLAPLLMGTKSLSKPPPWNQADNPLCLATFPPRLPRAGPVLEMLNRPFVVRSKGHLREAPHRLEQAQATSCPRTSFPQTAHLGQAALHPQLLLTVLFLRTPPHPPQMSGSHRSPCLPARRFLQPEGLQSGRIPSPALQGAQGSQRARELPYPCQSSPPGCPRQWGSPGPALAAGACKDPEPRAQPSCHFIKLWWTERGGRSSTWFL